MRLAATPYAAALVAQHAIHVYRRYRGDSSWASFFDGMESHRSHHLDAASITLEEAVRDYFYLRIADLASLAFCNDWTEPQRDDGSGYTVRVDGARLLITPDPFGGGAVKLEIAARELPDTPWRSPAEARAAFEAAPRVVVSGVASGD